MKKYCFGAYFRILYYCSKPEYSQLDLCSGLMKIFHKEYGISVDDTKSSKLFNCAEGLSRNVIGQVKTITVTEVKSHFIQYVASLLDENKFKRCLLAIRQIILEDDDIKDKTAIGSATKEELKTKANYDFFEFCAETLLYSCSYVKNKDGKPYIHLITEDYVNSFEKYENTISLDSVVISPSGYVVNTIEPNTFLEAFHEIDADLSLVLKNNNQLRLFRLSCDEGEYSYNALNEFLIENIGAYVYSREKNEELTNKKKTKSIAYQAIKVMRTNGKSGSRDAGNDLAQILVYAFLEEALGAPKIMSKVELVLENGAYKNKCDSIHFLTLEQNGKKVYELVFGAADISLEIKEAVDKAMALVKAIAQDKRREKGIISGDFLNRSFDPDATAFLKSVLLPNKNNVQTPNMAFGLFLGYSIGISSDVDSFEQNAAAKLESDVMSIIPYIVDKINDLNLKDRSFYIYFLPFNDAVRDKLAIMNDLLLVGGDS